jgi:VanZ family protein
LHAVSPARRSGKCGRPDGPVLKRKLTVAAGWALAALIVWLSLTPSPPQIDFGVDDGDKLEHVLAYAPLMFWFCLLYARNGTRLVYAALWIAMGIALEYAQRATGYRNFDVFDMLANALGVSIGWALAFAIPAGLAQKLR